MSTRAATRMVRTESKTGIPSDEVVFGRSAAMEEVRQKALKICRTDVTVLLTGEGGTGKEVLARWLHANSRFASGEFVKVNCAAIPGSLLESELFGHEKGAFTGANASKPGRVERAHRGTLFLDEIADLDPSLQSKLLHFLQDGYFCRLGDQTERTVETRVICATPTCTNTCAPFAARNVPACFCGGIVITSPSHGACSVAPVGSMATPSPSSRPAN